MEYIANVQFIGTIITGILLMELYIKNEIDNRGEISLLCISVILFVMCIGVCVTQHVLNLQNAYKRENERLKNALEQEESNIRTGFCKNRNRSF